MKKILYSFLVLIGAVAFAACDTDTENIGYKHKSSTDYAAIRAYRASDHEIMFGWFGNWDGGGASSAGSLMSLPDSLDMVSIWGSPWPLSDKQKADMNNVRKLKGTKILACIFTPFLGRYLDLPEGVTPLEYYNWGTTQEEQIEAAREYGRDLAKKVIECGYDGLDIDNEPEQRDQPAHFYSVTAWFCAFIEGLGEYLGPEAGKGYILQVDGHMTTGMRAEMDKYIDYFVAQSYYSTTYTDLDSRFNTVANFFSGTRAELAKKFMVTEDFEKYWTSGGMTSFRQRDGSYVSSGRGMAAWHPQENGEDLPKAGAGLYHIENEYRSTIKPYDCTRDMIQIMNPAVKPVEETPVP